MPHGLDPMTGPHSLSQMTGPQSLSQMQLGSESAAGGGAGGNGGWAVTLNRRGSVRVPQGMSVAAAAEAASRATIALSGGCSSNNNLGGLGVAQSSGGVMSTPASNANIADYHTQQLPRLLQAGEAGEVPLLILFSLRRRRRLLGQRRTSRAPWQRI